MNNDIDYVRCKCEEEWALAVAIRYILKNSEKYSTMDRYHNYVEQSKIKKYHNFQRYIGEHLLNVAKAKLVESNIIAIKSQNIERKDT